LHKVRAAVDAAGAVLFGSGITFGAYTVRPWLAAVAAGLLLLVLAHVLERRDGS
jgi:hypothetical protein